MDKGMLKQIFEYISNKGTSIYKTTTTVEVPTTSITYKSYSKSTYPLLAQAGILLAGHFSIYGKTSTSNGSNNMLYDTFVYGKMLRSSNAWTWYEGYRDTSGTYSSIKNTIYTSVSTITSTSDFKYLFEISTDTLYVTLDDWETVYTSNYAFSKDTAFYIRKTTSAGGLYLNAGSYLYAGEIPYAYALNRNGALYNSSLEKLEDYSSLTDTSITDFKDIIDDNDKFVKVVQQ